MRHLKHISLALINYLIGGRKKKKEQSKYPWVFWRLAQISPSVRLFEQHFLYEKGPSITSQRPSYLVIAADGAFAIQRGALREGKARGDVLL